MKSNQDPTADIYKMLDDAGLQGPNLLGTKEPFAKIINRVRTQLAMELKSYIVRRDHVMFNAGAESVEAKKIEVRDAK